MPQTARLLAAFLIASGVLLLSLILVSPSSGASGAKSLPTSTPFAKQTVAPLAAQGAPLPTDPSVIWDPRLQTYQVYLVPANVAPGTWYWKLVRADFNDTNEHCGDYSPDHDIFYVLTNEANGRVVNQTVWQGWPDGQASAQSDSRGIGDIAMWANYYPSQGPGPYRAWVDGLPSDTVNGMGLPADHHVSFVLYFQRTQASAIPPATSTPTGLWSSPTPSPTPVPSCTLSATVTPTSNAATPTATWTPVSTVVAPTPTNTSTATPTNTSTPTPTNTSTPTPTNTSTPVPTFSGVCLPVPLGTIGLNAAPKGLAVDAARQSIVVALYDSSSVAIVNAATQQVSAVWGTGNSGHANSVAAVNDSLYVAMRDTAQVVVLNANPGAPVTTLAAGNLPYGLAGGNNRVWVANYGGNSVTTLDALSDTALATTATGGSPALVASFGDHAFASYWSGGVVQVLASGQVSGTITALGSGTFGIAADPAHNLLFAGNRTTNQLSRIDAQTGSLLRQVTLTDVPYALAYNPRLNQLLVVLADTNQLGVFDADSLALLARLGVGTQGASGGDGAVWSWPW